MSFERDFTILLESGEHLLSYIILVWSGKIAGLGIKSDGQFW